jgi:signal transduction histidine kinase
MSAVRLKWPAIARGLSARLLVLTVFFVMISEVLIYVPSISRFRLTYLEDRITDAHLASLALKATPDNMVDKTLEAELLANAKLLAIVIKRPDRRTLMLTGDMPPTVDSSYDIRNTTPLTLIRDSFETLARGDRLIRVIGPIPDGSQGYLDIVLDERMLHDSMLVYSTNILKLSVLISLLTASLVFLSLHVMLVRPMRRITTSMTEFRKSPQNDRNVIFESGRSDEIGTAERELRHMQTELRDALRQREHLAALGAAVAKISHDLRNMLATAQLVSDRLANTEDPQVRSIGNRLMTTVDRAIDLCTQSLNYGRAEEAPPRRADFRLRDLVDEVATAVGGSAEGAVGWHNDISEDIVVNADREQIFRVLMNLGRNAMEAMPNGGDIRLHAEAYNGRITVDVADSGPGLPQQAREHLFEPFTGSTRAGGTGLGLAIARELTEAHGGTLHLLQSSPKGTTFRLELPGKPS